MKAGFVEFLFEDDEGWEFMYGSFDVAIVGLGAMGSAAAFQLSSRGYRILGLDKFKPPHKLGSSHGETRIIRKANFEHSSYVPIVEKAYILWEELERMVEKKLMLQTGGIMLGLPSGGLVSGAEQSAKENQLPYERITAEEVRYRHPALQPSGDLVGVWDPSAGILWPELCIEAQLDLALQNGAELRFHEEILSWKVDGDGVQVTTLNGVFYAERLLFAAGPWIPQLLPDLQLPLEIERQTLFWFEPVANAEEFSSDRCPIFIWDYGKGRHFYGFPNLGRVVKVSRMHGGEVTDPSTIHRNVSDHEADAIRALLQEYIPDANGRWLAAAVCMFTNTPDNHFLIDYHPIHSQVVIASPCSGHGFKYSSALGEILADLLTDREPNFNIELFRLNRFSQWCPRNS